jgi:catalase
MLPAVPMRRALMAGAALLALAVAPAAHAQMQAPAPAAEATLSERLVDSFEGVFGRHAGARRSGARGVCATGEWTATSGGAALSAASSLAAGTRAPVVARFSVGGGNPMAPENGASVRGLSIAFTAPNGDPHEFVLINAPVFGARTPESFLTFLRVRTPDPQTRQMNAQAVAAANAAHPDWMPQMAWLGANAPPASYAAERYHGVNTFLFRDAAGRERPARWTFEPLADRVGLTAEERQARGATFLESELRTRLAAGPAEWRVLLQLPEPGDPLDDATAAWPASRPTVEVARLRITGLAAGQAATDCAARMFNPLLLPEGIAPSADPILAIRPEVYAVSLSRRSQ